MEPIALHRTTILRPFTVFLADIGAPIDRTLQQVKLPILALDDPDYYIPSLAFWKFVEKIAAKENIQELGFLVGNQFGVNAIAPDYSKTLSHSPSLYHALLKTCLTVKSGISRSEMLVYCTDPGSTRFCHQTSFGIKHPNQFQMEWFALMAMIGIIQEFTGPLWCPKEIGLMSYRKPSPLIKEYPNCRFLNGQAYGFISIETPLLSLPPLAKSHHRNVKSKTELLSSPFGEPADDLLSSLKQVLQSYLQEGAPPIALAAEMANTSVRSLQRELSTAKLSYRDLLAQVRFTTATRLLKDTDSQVQEIAFKLGYQDASHFTRAFKRTAGMSPSEYRKSII